MPEGDERRRGVARGEVNRGLDDGLSKAFELALTPVVVALLGWLLDSRLDVTPLFTLVFFFLGVAGTSLAAWYRYDAAMKVHEDEAAARRAERPVRPRRTRLGPTAEVAS